MLSHSLLYCSVSPSAVPLAPRALHRPQDSGGTWLLGHESLEQLLGRLEPCRLAAAAGAAAAADQAKQQEAEKQQQQLLSTAFPFSLERGLGSMCLILLVRSPVQRQRDFAVAVVQQLARLADALRKAPPPNASKPNQGHGAGGKSPWGGGSAAQGAGGLQRDGRHGGAAEEGGAGAGGAASPPGPGSPPPPASMGLGDRRASAASEGSAGGAGGGSSTPVDAAAPSGRQRRFGGGFGAASRARQAAAAAVAASISPLPAAEAAADSALGVGSAALLQVSVWQRLVVLLPLLPTVRADREGELRGQLAGALGALLTAPHLRLEALQLGGCESAAACTAAAAAAQGAGQPLLVRLQHVLGALLSGTWAGWLRGNNKRLREVPEYLGTLQLWAALDALPQNRLPDGLRAQVHATLPLPPDPTPLMLPQLVNPGVVTNSTDSGGGSGGDAVSAAVVPRRWDPWVPLQMPPAPAVSGALSTGGGALGPRPIAPAVALLEGCVKRRGGPLAYSGQADDEDYYL